MSGDARDLVRIEGVRGFKSPQLHRVLAGQVALLGFLALGWGAIGSQVVDAGMAGAARRGCEDGIYFDHRGDC
jgi:hypothetical protein